MPLTNAGRDFINGAYMGAVTAPLFNSTNAVIGVGDSAAAFSAAQIDLQASVNKFRKAMDATYPQRTANVTVYKSTYASAEANYAWNEWGVFNDPAAGTMLNRVVEYNGTKLAGQTWYFQVTLTINIGT